MSVARAAAAAFGKQHHGQLLVERHAQHAVGLGMVARALRAREDSGVVGHDHGARPLLTTLRAVDGANARHHAVGRGVGDEVFHAAAARLRGHGQRAVFDEAACIAQVGNVFARGALALRVALGHRSGALGVECEGVTVDHALQVGADVVRVVLVRLGLRHHGGVLHGFEHQQRLGLHQIRPRRCGQRLHTPGMGRQQHMLHLHGFEHGQVGTSSHHIAHGHGPLHQACGHGGANAVRVGSGRGGCACNI